MAVTKAWDETKPAGIDSPRNGDDEMREGIKQATRERMNIGGHFWPSATDTKSGRHQCGQEQAASGDGTPLAGEFYIYASNGTTRVVTVADSTAGSFLNASTLAFLCAAFSMAGTFTASGASVTTAAGNTTLGNQFIHIITGTGSVTITLPDATLNAGRMYYVISGVAAAAGNTHVVVPAGADLLSYPSNWASTAFNNVSLRLASEPNSQFRGAALLMANGTTWYMLSGADPA